MIVFLLCEGILNWLIRYWSDTLVFSKHGNGHAFKCLAFWDTNRDTLSPSSPCETRVAKARISGSKWVQNTELDIVNGRLAIYVFWPLGWRYISSLCSANESQGGRNICLYCCDPALSVLVIRSLSVLSWNRKPTFKMLTWQNAKLWFSEGTPLFSKLTSSCSEKSGLWRSSNASQFYNNIKMLCWEN